MKKVLMIAFCLVLGSIVMAAPFATSIPYVATGGIFTTALDDASSAGQGFLDLDKTYIFAGQANLNKEAVISNTTNALGVNNLGAVSLGAYFNTKNPWSIFSNLYHPSTLDSWQIGGNTVNDTYLPKEVGTNTQKWMNTRVETKTYGSLASEVNDSAQYLMELNGMVIGGIVQIITKDDSISDNNFKSTTTEYYDAADVGVAPDPKQDYTIEESKRRRINNFVLALSSPLFIPGEKVDQTFSTSLVFGEENVGAGSGKRTKTYLKPVKTDATFTNVLHDDTINKDTTFMIGASYQQDRKSPFVDSDEKDFYFGGSLNLDFSGKKVESLSEEQDYQYTLVGTTMNETKKKYDYTSTEEDFGISADLMLSALAGHRFSYDLGEGFIFALDPKVSLAFARSTNGKAKGATSVVKTDGNSDGVVDTIVTTEIEYADTSSTGGGGRVTTSLAVNLQPSCAFKYQPATWKVGFTLGSQLYLIMDLNRVQTKEAYNKTTTTTENIVAGTSTTTTSELYSGSGASTTNTVDWVAHLQNTLSMNWNIAENVTLYADLSATVGSSVLDFGNFTVQTVISLP